MVALTLESLLAQLHEKKPWIFEQCFRTFDVEELQAVLDEALGIEKAGGEMTADGARCRTAGGVFMRLLRTKFPTKMAPILKEQTSMRRKIAARRYGESQSKQDDLICPAEVLGQLIGKGGVVINKFRRETGCTITLLPDKGRVRIEGPDVDAQACRAQVQEHIRAAILHTHGDYAEQVLVSDFMIEGCKKSRTKTPWAELLHAWIIDAVELTTASAMPARLRTLAAKAPQEVVEEVTAQLTAKPDLLDSREVAECVLRAIQGGPCTPSKAKDEAFDLQDLAGADFVAQMLGEPVWTAPDGECFTKARFLEEVGDEEMWDEEIAAQEESSTPEEAQGAPEHAPLTPEKEEKVEKVVLTMKKKKKSPVLGPCAIPVAKKPSVDDEADCDGARPETPPPGHVMRLASCFGEVRRTTPPRPGAADVDAN